MAARVDPLSMSKEEKDRLRGKALAKIPNPLLRAVGTGFNAVGDTQAGQALDAGTDYVTRKLENDIQQIGDDYRTGGLIGERGVLSSATRGGPYRAGANLAESMGGTNMLHRIMYGQDGEPIDVDALAAERATARAPDPTTTAAHTMAEKIRANPGAAGLTRIVKNPDGSYTNMGSSYEQPGAEVRYYNQYGNREGVDPTPRGTTGDPAGWAAQNATAKNLDTDDIAMLYAAGGRQGQGGGYLSKGYAERGRQSLIRAAEEARLAQYEPEQRAMLEATQMREGGANDRARMTNLIALRGQDLTSGTAAATREQTAAKAVADAQMAERKRYGELGGLPYAREYAGSVLHAGDDELAASAGDPNNIQSSLAMQGMLDAMRATGDIPEGFDPGTSTKRSKLGKLFFDNDYTVGDSWFNDFDPSDSGIPDEEWDAAVRAWQYSRRANREKK